MTTSSVWGILSGFCIIVCKNDSRGHAVLFMPTTTMMMSPADSALRCVNEPRLIFIFVLFVFRFCYFAAFILNRQFSLNDVYFFPVPRHEKMLCMSFVNSENRGVITNEQKKWKRKFKCCSWKERDNGRAAVLDGAKETIVHILKHSHT